MKRSTAASLVGAVIPLWAPAALAQAAAAPAPSASPDQATGAQDRAAGSGLQEIVVTAQKRVERLQDVPVAVTALTANDLAASSIEAQVSLPRVTPNLTFTDLTTNVAAFIRGVGTSLAGTGLESSVPVYFNDIYIPRAQSALFSLNDVERIEVLKGPQGTLYGRNASGGAIRVITFDPKPNFEAAASATYGTFDRKAVDGMINVPLSDDVAVRFAARHDENDGYVHNLFPGVPNRMFDRDQNIVTGKLLAHSGPLTFKIEGDWSEVKGSGGFPNLYGAPEQVGAVLGGCVGTHFYEACVDVPTVLDVKQYGGAGRVDYDLGPATVSSITGYRYNSGDNRNDVDATGYPLILGVGKGERSLYTTTKQITQELQIASNGSGPIKYVAGLYYLREHSTNFATITGVAISGNPANPYGFGVTQDAAVRTQAFAGYAQVDVAATDTLTVTLGGRYTDETKLLLRNRLGTGPSDALGAALPGQLVFAPSEPQRRLKFNKFLPKATLSYRPDRGLLVYATYSVGFKSGGFSLPQTPSDVVKPEILKNYEVGLKYEHGRMRFNGSAFYYDFRNRQVDSYDPNTSSTRTTNAANAKIKGLEGDFTWIPVTNLELGLGAGYIDSDYRDYIGQVSVPCAQVGSLSVSDAVEAAGVAAARAACVAGANVGLATVVGRNFSGNNLENAPSFTGYARAQYTFDLASAGKLTASSTVNYRSTAYFDPGNFYPDRRRTLLSARLGWVSANGHISGSVYAENLTDKKYNTAILVGGFGGFRVPAQPRSVNVEIGYRF